MTPHENDYFLWTWARQRQRGRLGIALLGAGIGALGGAAFGALMLYGMQGAEIRLNEEEMAPFLIALGRAIGPVGLIFTLAIPAFAFLGAIVSDRVWAMQESLYQGLIDQGARPPTEKPRYPFKERAPSFAVIGFFVLVFCGLLYGLFYEIHKGDL